MENTQQKETKLEKFNRLYIIALALYCVFIFFRNEVVFEGNLISLNEIYLLSSLSFVCFILLVLEEVNRQKPPF